MNPDFSHFRRMVLSVGMCATIQSCPFYRKTHLHTTHIQDLPGQVTIVRRSHPFEGKTLGVFSKIHRQDRLYLCLILPDGTRSLIPAEWTDINSTVKNATTASCSDAPTPNANIGSPEDLLRTRTVVDALLRRLADHNSGATDPSLQEPHRATALSQLRGHAAPSVLCVGPLGRQPQDGCDRGVCPTDHQSGLGLLKIRRRTMTDISKINPTHTQRSAIVYVRQSTVLQVEHNRESTDRQYSLAWQSVNSAGPNSK